MERWNGFGERYGYLEDVPGPGSDRITGLFHLLVLGKWGMNWGYNPLIRSPLIRSLPVRDILTYPFSPFRLFLLAGSEGVRRCLVISAWNPKQPFINGCFNWMIPNLYIGNGCFTKHPFINGCLGFQVMI